MSEEESISGFSSTNLSHPSGFIESESRLMNNVRLPSDESLLQKKKTKRKEKRKKEEVNHGKCRYILIHYIDMDLEY